MIDRLRYKMDVSLKYLTLKLHVKELASTLAELPVFL